ncbi:MAG TPA: peptide ABC transporter substrate-binding protein [Anaerolineales bacterium]|nr:peptide ABC transporter substrate-binding protein [Anaerolineales bacterium]
MITRKSSYLFALTLMVVLSIVLSACSPSSIATQDGASSEQPATDSNKNITMVIAEDPPSFNPMVADTGYDALVMELVMLGMTDVDPNGEIFPELAVELPTIDNGGVVLDEEAGTMTVTWQMRDDVKWQDGTPVSADDVIFTWNAISDPVNGSWMPGSDYIDSVEKVDDHSFTVSYNTIYPGYLTQFGGEQLAVWPAHYCDMQQGFVAWDCGRQPLSNGPFVLTEWAEGDHMTFTKNENYYQAGKPEIEQVIVRIVPDDTVRRTMMLNGDADIDMWINVNTINELKDSQVVGVSLSPTDRWVMRLFMNQAAKGTTDPASTPHPILSDVRVRQAIRMAVDVDTINNEIFQGLAHPVWTEFFRPPYVCDVERPTFDPEGAKALLEEAGWTDADGDGVRECQGCETAEQGYPMEMEFIAYAEYGEPLELTQQLIAEMLGEIGIKMNISIVEGSVLWDLAENGGIEQSGNFDIDIWDDGYAGVDPTDYLWEAYSQEAMEPGNGWNFFRWDNPVVDALIDEAYTLDEQTRQETFCAIGDFINEEVPVVHLFTSPNADAYSTRLEGVQSSVNDLVTWNIADWKTK